MNDRLAIDARWLVGGIGTYTRHLLEGLWKRAGGFEVHAITKERHVETLKPWCAGVTVVDLPIYTMREQWEILRAAKECDLLHVPHYNAPLLRGKPLVVTIHDIIHVVDPEFRSSYKAWAYAWPVIHWVTRKARHIITVSEYSKAQIVERFGVNPSKITAIYNAVHADFQLTDHGKAQQTVSEALGVQVPYILYVGSLKRYKNISSLLKAFALLCKVNDLPQHLLILGNGGRTKQALQQECAQLGISNRTQFVTSVAQQLLPAVYAAADMLVMPSRIEGFGLPVLEAMACGTPVICSRATSLPEVGGDAVVYFDPQSPQELAAAMENVLSSSELQGSLRSKGLQRAARFSLKEFVEKHIQVYQAAIG